MGTGSDTCEKEPRTERIPRSSGVSPAGVERLEETATFTVAWLPGPFISAEVMDRALERVRCALAPGGWLIFGFSIPYQTLRSSTHSRVCGLCAAAAIPGLQRRSKISSGRSFSSKLKSTHPRRRSRWWARNGQSKASDSELNEDKEMTRSATQSRVRPGSALPGPGIPHRSRVHGHVGHPRQTHRR